MAWPTGWEPWGVGCCCVSSRARPGAGPDPRPQLRGLRAAAQELAGRQLRWRAARADLGLHRGEFPVDVRGGPGFVELPSGCRRCRRRRPRAPRLQQFVQRGRARLHGGDLVLRPLQRCSRIAQRGRDPVQRFSFTEFIADAAVYWAFSVSFCVREVVNPLLQGLERLLHLLLFLGQLLALRLHPVDLGLGSHLPGEGFPGQGPRGPGRAPPWPDPGDDPPNAAAAGSWSSIRLRDAVIVTRAWRTLVIYWSSICSYERSSISLGFWAE